MDCRDVGTSCECHPHSAMAWGVHWGQSPRNGIVNKLIYHKLIKALCAEKIRYDRQDQRDRLEPTDHGTYRLLVSPEQRINERDVLCVLHDLGIGHHFTGSIPFRREPLPLARDGDAVVDASASASCDQPGLRSREAVRQPRPCLRPWETWRQARRWWHFLSAQRPKRVSDSSSRRPMRSY